MYTKFANFFFSKIVTFTYIFLYVSNPVNCQSIGYGADCDFNEQCPSIPSSVSITESSIDSPSLLPGICDARWGKCCDPRFDKDVTECITTYAVGDSCMDDIQCRRIPGICRDGVCKCDPDTSLPSILNGRDSCKCKDGFVKGSATEDCREKLNAIHEEPCKRDILQIVYRPGSCSLHKFLCSIEINDPPRNGFCRGGCGAVDSFGYEWVAAFGTFARNKCPFEKKYKFYDAKWFCGKDGVFNSTVPDYSGCNTDWVKDILKNINNTKEMRFEDALNLAEQIIGNVSTALASLLPGNGSDFYGHEISKLLHVLNQLAEKFIPLANPDDNLELASVIFKTVDILLEYETPWLGLNEPNANTFSKVLDTMSNGPLKVAQKSCFRDGVMICNFPIGLKMGHISPKELPHSIEMISRNYQIRGQKSSFKIILSSNEEQLWVASSISSKYTRKYSNQKLWTQSDDVKFQTNSDLLSFSVLNLGTNITRKKRDIVASSLKHPIELTLWHTDYSWSSEVKKIPRNLHPGENPTAVKDLVQCVFWDAVHGAWSSEGCMVTGGSGFSTTCVCDHLSSFTVVMKVHKYIGTSIPLRAIAIVLVILLMLYLVFKIFLLKTQNYASESEDDIGKQRSNVIKNMSLILTLFCYGLVFFLVDKNYFYFGDVTCYRIGMLGHLMSLVTVLVLTLEFLLATIDYACLTQIDCIAVAARDKPYIIFLGIPFGISFLFVAATVAVDHYDGLNTRAYGGEFCWLDEPFVNALFLPLWILLSFNYFLLFLIVRKACGYIRAGSGTVPTVGGRDAKATEVKFYLKNGVMTNSLALSTWLIAFFHLGPHFKDSSILSWIFPIIFTLQGILMDQVMDKNALIKRTKKRLFERLMQFSASVPAAGSASRGGPNGQQMTNKDSSPEMTKMLSSKKEKPDLESGNPVNLVTDLQINQTPAIISDTREKASNGEQRSNV